MSETAAAPLLTVEGLKKYYPVRGGVFSGKVGDVRAVDGVYLTVREGETLGLVGEIRLRQVDPRPHGHAPGGADTGGRKSCSRARTSATAGRAEFCSSFAARFRSIFQDPYSSLNPRMTVGEIVREPLVVHKIGTKAAVEIEKVRVLA